MVTLPYLWDRFCSDFRGARKFCLANGLKYCSSHKTLKVTSVYLGLGSGRIDPPELHLNKDNASYTEAPFSDLHLSILSGFVSSKIYDERYDLDFDMLKAMQNTKRKHVLLAIFYSKP